MPHTGLLSFGHVFSSVPSFFSKFLQKAYKSNEVFLNFYFLWNDKIALHTSKFLEAIYLFVMKMKIHWKQNKTPKIAALSVSSLFTSFHLFSEHCGAACWGRMARGRTRGTYLKASLAHSICSERRDAGKSHLTIVFSTCS